MRKAIGSHTEQSHHSRPGTAFAEAKKDTKNVHLLCACSHGNEASNNSPCNLKTRKPEAGSDVGQDNLRGNKHDAVGNIEKR